MRRLFLSSLSIHRFRNLSSVTLAPSERFNVVSGLNGSGKTNLLEAIYFFSILRSFRTVLRRDIISDGASDARLKGVFGGAAAGLTIEIEISEKDRRILKDGKENASTADHFYLLPMVLFHPANMSLIQGGPKERRRYMDRALFQADRFYPALLSDYNRALINRNRLLKSMSGNRASLKPYDIQLARLGSALSAARSSFVESARASFSDAIGRIGLGITGEMRYLPDTPGDEPAVLEALEKGYGRDSERGFTTRGPHADDLEIVVGERGAKRFASQGQQRLAVLAMKIAEVITLSTITGRIPILLLDDISSELDRERNTALLSFLKEVGGQVFVSTTHLDHVRLNEERRDFFVENGVVSTRSLA